MGKTKLETRNLKMEDLLKDAGFQTLEKRGERILYASGATDFGNAHAAVLQAACNCPEYIGCSRFETVGGPILIVHRTLVEPIEIEADDA